MTARNYATLPTAPLLAAATRHAETLDPLAGCGDRPGGTLQLDKPSDRMVGNVLGCGPHMVQKMRKRGVMTVWAADRYAARLGVHPCLIWGDAWWVGTCLEDAS